MLRSAIFRSHRPLAASVGSRNALTLACSLLSLRRSSGRSEPRQRQYSTSSTWRSKPVTEASVIPEATYHGPLTSTFRRLKIFSLSSLALSSSLAPFMFLIESNLPLTARFALATIAVGTSGISTALVGWCGKPYVTTLIHLTPDGNSGAEGVEMTTLDLLLRPRITRVYDPTFLIETKRAFAKWELAETFVLPGSKAVTPGHEETVADTRDTDDNVIGRWIVKWGERGEGTCREVGSVIRHFNVHEELLH